MVARLLRPRPQSAEQPVADPGALVAAACQKAWRTVLEDFDGLQRALGRRDARSAAPVSEHSVPGRQQRRQQRNGAAPAPLCSLSAVMAEHLCNSSRFPAEGRLGRGLTTACWELADAAVQRAEDLPQSQPKVSDYEENEREERILISEARSDSVLDALTRPLKAIVHPGCPAYH